MNGCTPEYQIVPRKDGSTCSLELYYCHEWGHIPNNFPQIPPDRIHGRGGGHGGGSGTGGRSGTGMLHIRVRFDHDNDGIILSSWILLDTCLTSSAYNSKEMIGNINDFTSDKNLMVYKNGGSNTFTQMAPFKFLPMEVHFNIYSMDNILSIKDVFSIILVHTSMYSRKERAIIV